MKIRMNRIADIHIEQMFEKNKFLINDIDYICRIIHYTFLMKDKAIVYSTSSLISDDVIA